MKISAIINENINNLPPLVRELFTGSKRKCRHIPTPSMINLGDYLINFSALFNCNIYVENITDDKLEGSFYGYIKDLLNEGRGHDLGVSICIQKELLKQTELYREHTKFTIDEHFLTRWVELRKRIRKTKRVKKLSFEFRPEIIPIVNDFLSNFEFINKLKINDDQKWEVTDLKYPIPLNPFFIIHQCETCQNNHLFAFDKFSPSTGEYQFMCWGNHHDLTMSNEDIDFISKLNDIKKKMGTFQNKQNHQTSFLPLIATSYPTLHRLVELLFEETQLVNQKELWANKAPEKILLITQDDLNKHSELLKNLILIDCIEEGPISVIRKVARKEGAAELPGYFKILLEEKDLDEKVIKKEISNLDNKCKEVIKDRGISGRDREDIKDEIYSVEIAKLLGFPVSDISNIHNLEFFIKKINTRITDIENDKSDEDISFEHVLKDSLLELEELYKELLVFYEFIFEQKIQSKVKKDSGKYEGYTKKDTFGTLNRKLRELNKLFSDKADKTNKIWGDKFIFQYKSYSKLIKEGSKDGDLFNLRNELSHEISEKRDHFADCRKKDKCIEYLNWIKDVMNFFAESPNRVFPYKITITVLSSTHQGIRTCQYVTELTNLGRGFDESQNYNTQTKIYTEYDIDFTKIYYCLPHRRRSLENLWINPLLIPMDEVGYNKL